MIEKYALSHLPVSGLAVIYSVDTESEIKTRLEDLGMIPDTLIKCVAKSPFGSAKAYAIRGTVIVIRAKESDRIKIKHTGDAFDA